MILAIFGLWRYLDASEKDLIDDRVATAEAAALTTQAFVAEVVASARTLALSPEVTDPSRRNEVPALLERVRQANPDWEQVAVLDSLGDTIASTELLPLPAPEVGKLVRGLMNDERSNVGVIDAPPDGTARLLVGVPLSFPNNTRGVLLVSPSLLMLAAELRAQARGPQVELVLTNVDGARLIGVAERPTWLSNPSILDAVVAPPSSRVR